MRLSVKDLPFGIALGFGVMSANDLMMSLFMNLHSSFTTPLQFTYESITLVSLGIWMVYCLLPESAPRPVVLPASSTIYRWSEIASALGHTGTKVAIQQPAKGFFLTDVEAVVEKVLARNQRAIES
jgi:hypothetical protein